MTVAAFATRSLPEADIFRPRRTAHSARARPTINGSGSPTTSSSLSS